MMEYSSRVMCSAFRPKFSRIGSRSILESSDECCSLDSHSRNSMFMRTLFILPCHEHTGQCSTPLTKNTSQPTQVWVSPSFL